MQHEGSAAPALADEGPPTVVTPHVPSIRRLLDDAAFRRLQAFVQDARASLDAEAAHWDQLRQVATFCRALRFAKDGAPLTDDEPAESEPLLARFDDAVPRRAIACAIAATMPAASRAVRPLRADGARGPAVDVLRDLPVEIAARADDGFALRREDVPVAAPIFGAHLRGRALIEAVFRPGQRGVFLVGKHYCPAAANERCGGGEAIPVVLEEPCVVDGKKGFRVVVPPARAYAVDETGGVRAGDVVNDGIEARDGLKLFVPLQHLVAWLLATGSQGTGLDLDDVDDRALLVVASHLLRTRALRREDGVERTAHAWLESADATCSPAFLDRVRAAARDACFEAVAAYAPDHRALALAYVASDDDVTRARFARAEGDAKAAAAIDWRARALALLEETGVARAALDRAGPATGARLVEVAWTQAVLQSGYVGGRLPAQAQGDAFARLATTLLAPIGMLPLSSLREGRGASLLRVLSLPDADGLVDAGVPERVVPAARCVGLPATVAYGLPRRADDPSRLDVARLDDDGRDAPIHDVAALQDRLAALAGTLPRTDA